MYFEWARFMDSSDTLTFDPGGLEPPAALAEGGCGVAYVVADLQNRQRWAEILGEGTARRLADLHDRVARSVMKKHQGRQVGPSGEYQMLFGRPDHALDFALAYFQALDKLSQGGATEIQSGVGIHYGRDGVRGPEIARKLASLAGERRILLTRDAFDHTRRHLEAARRLGWQACERYLSEDTAEPLDLVEIQVPRGNAEDSASGSIHSAGF